MKTMIVGTRFGLHFDSMVQPRRNVTQTQIYRIAIGSIVESLCLINVIVATSMTYGHPSFIKSLLWLTKKPTEILRSSGGSAHKRPANGKAFPYRKRQLVVLQQLHIE